MNKFRLALNDLLVSFGSLITCVICLDGDDGKGISEINKNKIYTQIVIYTFHAQCFMYMGNVERNKFANGGAIDTNHRKQMPNNDKYLLRKNLRFLVDSARTRNDF